MVKGSGRQTIGGKSPDACPSCDRKHPPGKCPLKQAQLTTGPSQCEVCGNRAKKNTSLCGPCRKQSKKAKAEKKRFGWSKVSTIHVKGVAKNRWRSTYKGPRVRDENYLIEKKDE